MKTLFLVLLGSPLLASGVMGQKLVEGGSKHFAAVREHLELGGGSFGYIDVDGDLDKVGGVIDEAIKLVLDLRGGGDVPPELANLSFGEIASDLGFSNLAAVGWSSRQDGDHVHMRNYLHTPGGRQGVLKVSGGDAVAFVAASMAPVGSDLIFEQELDLAALLPVVDKVLRRIGIAELSQGWAEMSSQSAGLPGLTIGQLVAKLDTRLTVIGRLHPEQRIELSDAPVDLPQFDLLIALDNMAWLVEKLQAEMPPEVAQGIVKGDGFLRMPLPPMPPEKPLFQPVIHFDIASGRLLVASSVKFADACLAGGGGLFAEASFKSAAKGLPAKGNSLVFFSPRIGEEFRKLIAAGVESDSTMSKKELELGLAMVEKMMPGLKGSYVAATSNLPDGVLSVSNSPGGGGGIGAAGVSVVAIAAAIAVPAMSKVQQKAKQSKELQMLKQCSLGLRVWAGDNEGGYPAEIDQDDVVELLGDDRIFRFAHPQTGEVKRPLYVAGLTDSSPASYVVLASPWIVDGERAVVYADGSAQIVDERLFEKQLAETLEKSGGKLME